MKFSPQRSTTIFFLCSRVIFYENNYGIIRFCRTDIIHEYTVYSHVMYMDNTSGLHATSCCVFGRT